MDIFVGIVLIDSRERIYLIKEDDKNKIGKGRWNLPGGSVDGNESLTQAAKRELLEESGYDTHLDSMLGIYYCKKGGVKWIYTVFGALMSVNKKRKAIDPGIKEGKWFERDEFMHMDGDQLVHPDMQLVYSVFTENKGLSLDNVKFINYDNQ